MCRCKDKGKAVTLQSWSGPEGSRKLRFPDFMTTAQDGSKVVSLTHRPPLPPRKYTWYSFLLEAESTPGPQCDRKVYVTEKFQLHHRESNLRPASLQRSALTTTPPRARKCVDVFLLITNLMYFFVYLFIYFISLYVSSIKCSSSGDRIVLIHHLV